MYRFRVGSASRCAATLGPDRSASTSTVGATAPRPAARFRASVVRPGLPGPLATATTADDGAATSRVGDPDFVDPVVNDGGATVRSPRIATNIPCCTLLGSSSSGRITPAVL